MRSPRIVGIFVLLIGSLVTGAPIAGQAPAATLPDSNFDVQRVADGVYAVIRKEPPGLIFRSNNVFIVNDDDVVVVDANFTPTTTKEVIAAIAKVTPKPVSAVINTHWHNDHIEGNQAYRAAFPKVEFIGHASAAADMATTGAANRRQLLQLGPQMMQQLEIGVEQSKSMTGGALSDEERASHLSDIAIARQYFAEAPTVEVIPPTRTVTDRLVLTRGSRTIEILHLGRGHTAADLVVRLPRENVVITGDLVVWPVPLIGSTSFPSEFAATLQKLIDLKPAVFVPGHGATLRDDTYLRMEQRVLQSLSSQVAAAAGRGEPIEQVRRSVNLDEFRNQIAGTSQLRRVIFDMYVLQSGVSAAFRETRR